MKKLLDILEERKIKKSQLADAIGVDRSALYGAFSGKKPLYPSLRKRIMDYFGCYEHELFEAIEQKKP